MSRKIILLLIILGFSIGQLIIVPSVAAAEKAIRVQNITNLDQFTLSKKAQDFIKKNGFVVTPGKEENDISDVYIACRKNNEPIFVTTDAILHVSHILFDFNLRIAEIYKFVKELDNLTDAMLKASSIQYQNAQDQAVKEAARRNLAFFAVAKKLLDPEYKVPNLVSSLVDKELKLISAHKGITLSPIMANSPLRDTINGEDYSQYVPRGHYTRNEQFKRYFKAMMWYGRMAFALPDREDTLQALLVLNALLQEDSKLIKVWERIYEPTVFFVGRTDDLNIYDYKELAHQVYGKEISIEEIANAKKLTLFIAKAEAIKKAKIVSCYVDGIRFMGQRFIPDSYIFERLTGYPWRFFPKSLDVMAILGSGKAKALLKEQGDFAIPEYKENFAELEKEFGTSNSAAEDWVDWKQNLYWRWLYCLKPLFEEKDNKYPKFMQSDAWLYKELAAACASWAELRHDTILYAKQTYAPKAMPRYKFTKGYVETYPEVYRRVASLVKEMREGLGSRGLLIEECKNKLLRFEELLKVLEQISRKELAHQKISGDEYNTIWQIGDILKDITEFSKEVRERVASATDNKMAVIADVHTDINSGRVLEEGVGNPYYIYVAVESNGVYQLTKGAVFSYFEFKWPMEDRLTDEKWQKLLEQRKEPPMPDWTNKYIL
jgi:hypothetical protein